MQGEGAIQLENLIEILGARLYHAPIFRYVEGVTSDLSRVKKGVVFAAYDENGIDGEREVGREGEGENEGKIERDVALALERGAYGILSQGELPVRDKEVAWISAKSLDNAILGFIKYAKFVKNIEIYRFDCISFSLAKCLLNNRGIAFASSVRELLEALEHKIIIVDFEISAFEVGELCDDFGAAGGFEVKKQEQFSAVVGFRGVFEGADDENEAKGANPANPTNLANPVNLAGFAAADSKTPESFAVMRGTTAESLGAAGESFAATRGAPHDSTHEITHHAKVALPFVFLRDLGRVLSFCLKKNIANLNVEAADFSPYMPIFISSDCVPCASSMRLIFASKNPAFIVRYLEFANAASWANSLFLVPLDSRLDSPQDFFKDSALDSPQKIPTKRYESPGDLMQYFLQKNTHFFVVLGLEKSEVLGLLKDSEARSGSLF